MDLEVLILQLSDLYKLFSFPLIYFGLRYLRLNFNTIGFTSKKWKQDAVLGTFVAIFFVIIDFLWIIPNSGGANKTGITEILIMLDHSWINILWAIPLVSIFGPLTEELLNRGFFIGGIASIFKGSRTAVLLASILSILFFSAGHLPTNVIEWIEILYHTIFYTILYVYTKRLTASIVAHGLWNTLAVIFAMLLYS